jgi:hypothetical protein
LLEGLLAKDPAKRLGATDGTAEIKAHPWCSNVNWDRVLRKRVKPPYKPNLQQSNLDPEYLNCRVSMDETASSCSEESKLELPCIYFEAVSTQHSCYSARYMGRRGLSSNESSTNPSVDNTPRYPQTTDAISQIITENTGISNPNLGVMGDKTPDPTSRQS